MRKMKSRLFFASLMCAFCLSGYAQAEQEGYRPFAQEGKTWEAREGMIMENIYGNCIDGDTLIDGENWKKVYNYHGFPEFNYSYYAAIRDVGTKVYAIAKGSSRPRLLYDFGLKEGQTVRCGVEGNAFGCLLDADEKPDTLLGFEFASSLRVEHIDTIETRGLKFRRFTLTFLDHFKYPLIDRQFTNEQGILYDTGNVIWVEGIGSNVGPFIPWWPLQPQHAFFTSCYLDKTLIFGFSDFYMSSMQENYRPLVESGKKWTYHNGTYRYEYDYHYMLEGDTIVAGKNCMKMYSDNKDNNGGTRYEGALYEENKKVYCFYPEKDETALLYDFGCKVGETLKIGDIDLITLSIDTIVGIICKGERYDFQAQRYDEEMGEPFVMGTLSWVKGVGATLDFFNMLPLAGNYNSLIACEVNGEILYQTAPNAVLGVRRYMHDIDGAAYDLLGHRLSSIPAKGVYIRKGRMRIVR